MLDSSHKKVKNPLYQLFGALDISLFRVVYPFSKVKQLHVCRYSGDEYPREKCPIADILKVNSEVKLQFKILTSS